jgi:hypothetical protein
MAVEERWARWWQWQGKSNALKKRRDMAAVNVGVCFQSRAIDGSVEA